MRRSYRSLSTITSVISLALSDEEALLYQLCYYLYQSGIFFDDASAMEIAEGEKVVKDFFEQEEDLMSTFIARVQLQHFCAYLKEYGWTDTEMKKRLLVKLRNSFKQLAQGKTHTLNLHRNIQLALQGQNTEALHRFLLVVEAYYQNVIQKISNVDQKFNATDIMKLRQNILEKWENRKFVNLILKDIHTRSGYKAEEIDPSINRNEVKDSINFTRPVSEPTKKRVLQNNSASLPASVPASAPHPASAPTSVAEISQQTSDLFSTENSSSNSHSRSETTKPSTVTQAMEEVNELPIIPDEEDDFVIGSAEENTADDDSEVLYGSGRITPLAVMNFIIAYPESAIKFLYRKELDGKMLPAKTIDIYEVWENRGMKRGTVRKVLLEFTQWKQLPTGSLIEIISQVRDHIYEVVK